MKYKNVENLIDDSLNSDKPNKSVLNNAKEYMESEKQNGNAQVYHAKKKWILASASTLAVALIIIIIAPYLFDVNTADENYIDANLLSKTAYTSIESYANSTDNELLYYDYEIRDCYLYSDESGKPVFILENYVIEGKELSLGIAFPDYKDKNINIFSKNYGCNKEYNIDNGQIIKYEWYSASNEYYAIFKKEGYTYFITANAANVDEFLALIEELL